MKENQVKKLVMAAMCVALGIVLPMAFHTIQNAGSIFLPMHIPVLICGLLKNEEIYNIFDTDKFLNRPALVSVSNTSGAAGIAYWINAYYKLPQGSQVDKNSELVSRLKEWVDKEYEEGRVTVLTDDELIAKIDSICKELHIKL